jgi:allophanate hydrolase
MSAPTSLDLASLQQAYAAGTTTPAEVIDAVYARIAQRGEDAVWIHLVPAASARAAAEKLGAPDGRPLFGVPFAVKDNIDVAGLPTTAACPEFSYVATETATVVQRLLEAGAILIGKTNLDQFATGLVGVRSPYGAPSCVFDPDYISGGSSSGSAVATAAGLVTFALGTDTAGSGRVPAAFNNLVGWKPTRGLLSNRGLVPACRSLDCISVFALTAEDARRVAEVVSVFDPWDAYARPQPSQPGRLPAKFRYGVPAFEQLAFFGDAEAAQLFAAARERLSRVGGEAVEIDYAPFRETAELLYAGPWVAERLAAVTPFLDEHPDALLPVTAKIIGGGRKYSAMETFRAYYRLEELRRKAAHEWTRMDVLLLPTTGTIYSHAQLAAEPVQANTNLGYYTNFVNLLDLCGVAVPAGFRSNGLPFGVTLIAPAFCDDAVLALAGRYHMLLGGRLGGTSQSLETLPAPSPGPGEPGILLAVAGAHLSGQPLNHQLTSRGAVRVATTRTSAAYRLFVLPKTQPPKPGVVREPGFAGPGVEVELWRLSPEAFGSFVADVPPPMTIGAVELDSGQVVKGFLCEPYALGGAEEITTFGGWRAYLGNQPAEDGARRHASAAVPAPARLAR